MTGQTPENPETEPDDETPAIEVQYAVAGDTLPSPEAIRHWVSHALQDGGDDVELVVRLVDEAEMTALNQRYRGKSGVTNVLSFPYESLPGVSSGLLGDVVVCAPVAAEEAIRQGKSLDAHWAHLVMHGVLHLQGYDHHHDPDAHRMEALETRLLAGLGFADPYN
ncbi:MAG: rRNA maturation RNase YbeY [Gammaproteobacteria bacterium]